MDQRDQFPPDYEITLRIAVQGSKSMADDIADDLAHYANRPVTVFLETEVRAVVSDASREEGS